MSRAFPCQTICEKSCISLATEAKRARIIKETQKATTSSSERDSNFDLAKLLHSLTVRKNLHLRRQHVVVVGNSNSNSNSKSHSNSSHYTNNKNKRKDNQNMPTC
ncbi:putative uncharacterized protein DDB_G0283051 [Drosophila grimshawi]|uniref:putative uncharacterized protein DDB_G0283051 n=1 Tax=Drosophila grimshawi TaxID=7222 RepID=UPI001C935D1E|nr:putative uncharacterized protein DDB_G0283051 [Drosophila grimshawi]